MYTVLLIGVLSSLAVVHCNQLQDEICVVPPTGNVTITVLGLPGPEGNTGAVGPKGDEGGVGKPGVKGDKGVRGESGMVGMRRLPGVKGEKGKRGENGPVGPQGDTGLPGAVGEPGLSGVEGLRGKPGFSGLRGPAGLPGSPGVRGSPGPEGSTGTCNFSYPAYQKLTEDIRSNLTEEIRKELESDYFTIATLAIKCILYKAGFTGLSRYMPASSCKHIYQCSQSTALSGYYWINSQSTFRMYCAMNLTHCGNTTGGWTRVAYINSISSGCPRGLSYISSPRKMCRRSVSGGGCSSVTLPAYGGSYTQVCGRALGYQFSYGTRAFYNYHNRGENTLDQCYVDGLSVTYGNPRQHVWTFTSGSSKDENSNYGKCPCAQSSDWSARYAPSFVGNHFFCESGNSRGYSNYNRRWYSNWYLDDPLWDGKGCPRGSTCCNGSNRPWFYRELNSTAALTENMEVRMCLLNGISDANIGVEELEIYVS